MSFCFLFICILSIIVLIIFNDFNFIFNILSFDVFPFSVFFLTFLSGFSSFLHVHLICFPFFVFFEIFSSSSVQYFLLSFIFLPPHSHYSPSSLPICLISSPPVCISSSDSLYSITSWYRLVFFFNVFRVYASRPVVTCRKTSSLRLIFILLS